MASGSMVKFKSEPIEVYESSRFDVDLTYLWSVELINIEDLKQSISVSALNLSDVKC